MSRRAAAWAWAALLAARLAPPISVRWHARVRSASVNEEATLLAVDLELLKNACDLWTQVFVDICVVDRLVLSRLLLFRSQRRPNFHPLRHATAVSHNHSFVHEKNGIQSKILVAGAYCNLINSPPGHLAPSSLHLAAMVGWQHAIVCLRAPFLPLSQAPFDVLLDSLGWIEDQLPRR